MRYALTETEYICRQAYWAVRQVTILHVCAWTGLSIIRAHSNVRYWHLADILCTRPHSTANPP
jgi:hypothetical protein